MNDSLLLQILPEGIPRQPSLVDLLRRCVCSEKYPANFPWFNYFLCPNPWVKDLWSFKTILLILFFSMQWSRIVKFVKYENNEKYWPWHKHMVTWMCVSGPSVCPSVLRWLVLFQQRELWHALRNHEEADELVQVAPNQNRSASRQGETAIVPRSHSIKQITLSSAI